MTPIGSLTAAAMLVAAGAMLMALPGAPPPGAGSPVDAPAVVTDPVAPDAVVPDPVATRGDREQAPTLDDSVDPVDPADPADPRDSVDSEPVSVAGSGLLSRYRSPCSCWALSA
jgi:hypothetical protein